MIEGLFIAYSLAAYIAGLFVFRNWMQQVHDNPKKDKSDRELDSVLLAGCWLLSPCVLPMVVFSFGSIALFDLIRKLLFIGIPAKEKQIE